MNDMSAIDAILDELTFLAQQKSFDDLLRPYLDLHVETTIKPPDVEPLISRPAKRRLRPLAVRRREAARLMGVSVSTWRRWDAAGATPPSVTVGKLTLWPMRSLRLWVRWGCPSRAEFELRLQTANSAAVATTHSSCLNNSPMDLAKS